MESEKIIREAFLACPDMVSIVKKAGELRRDGHDVILINRLRKEAVDNLSTMKTDGFKKVGYKYADLNREDLKAIIDVTNIPRITNFITIEV